MAVDFDQMMDGLPRGLRGKLLDHLQGKAEEEAPQRSAEDRERRMREAIPPPPEPPSCEPLTSDYDPSEAFAHIPEVEVWEDEQEWGLD